MKKALKLSAILLLLSVSACGWQLRGASGEATIERLYIIANTPDSNFTRVLERYLRGSGIELVDNAGAAQYSLKIVKKTSKRRTATVSASARISERLLEERVEYLVTRPDGTVAIERSTATVERIYEYNEDNVLATENEAQLLKNEMHSDLARQIANRLRRLGKAPAGNTASPVAP
ncbi:MAG: hypothetical protein KBT88_06850 [Gammaproteobacteria bacterium]|nr:hypothetical protein [Gammaproteobacteria bacterium]MBQ0839489.1 hypothetical protein [Gammaproteobacteria bacterium]